MGLRSRRGLISGRRGSRGRHFISNCHYKDMKTDDTNEANESWNEAMNRLFDKGVGRPLLAAVLILTLWPGAGG